MLFATLVVGAVTLALDRSDQRQNPSARVKVFLDCAGADADDDDDEDNDDCHLDYLREELDFVEYVRDRSDAEVHVLVTRAETGARGQEYTLAFIGQQRFATRTNAVTVTTDASDSEEQIRRRLATATSVGCSRTLLETRSLPASR